MPKASVRVSAVVAMGISLSLSFHARTARCQGAQPDQQRTEDIRLTCVDLQNAISSFEQVAQLTSKLQGLVKGLTPPTSATAGLHDCYENPTGVGLYAELKVAGYIVDDVFQRLMRATVAEDIRSLREEGLAASGKYEDAYRKIAAIEGTSARVDATFGAHRKEVLKTAALIRGESLRRERATTSLCNGFNENGDLRYWCISYGVMSASFSHVIFLGSEPRGTGWGRLVSVGIPYAAVRVIPSSYVPWFAIDIGAYTAVYTATVSADASSSTDRACTGSNTEFERRLPCDGNPPIRPYAALAVGATFGKSGIGYLTVVPVSLGFAGVGRDPTPVPYYGLTLGALQLTGSL